MSLGGLYMPVMELTTEPCAVNSRFSSWVHCCACSETLHATFSPCRFKLIFSMSCVFWYMGKIPCSAERHLGTERPSKSQSLNVKAGQMYVGCFANRGVLQILWVMLCSLGAFLFLNCFSPKLLPFLCCSSLVNLRCLMQLHEIY